MSAGSLEQTSYPWRQIAQDWERYFTAPSRPSGSEVAKYNDWVAQISTDRDGRRGLVLGATPELRDALQQNGLNGYAIDINLEMLLAMTDLLSVPNPDEVLIKSNWLSSPLASEHFDLILGDAVFPNVPWGSRDAFYSEIHRLLRPGGHFINRAFFVPENKPYSSVDQVFEVYKDEPTSYTAATELAFDLHILTYDRADHLGSMQKVLQVLLPFRANNGFVVESKFLEGTLNIIWNDWLQSASEKVWVYPYQYEEEVEYRKRFGIVERFVSDDHRHSSLTPMYLLRKRA